MGQEPRVIEVQLDAATHDRQPVATRKTRIRSPEPLAKPHSLTMSLPYDYMNELVLRECQTLGYDTTMTLQLLNNTK